MTTTSLKLGFIGLGIMGAPMAGHLRAAGHALFIATRSDVHFIHWRGRSHRIEAWNALDRARQAALRAGGAEEIRAPMPGVVVGVTVQLGAEVEPGAVLLTIESMKLQTAIAATHAARQQQPGDSFVRKRCRFYHVAMLNGPPRIVQTLVSAEV